MKGRLCHVLHLDRRGLAWARIERGGGRLRVVDSGRIDGEAQVALDAWRDRAAPADEPVFLYDGRPMVYSFRFELPRQARRQLHRVVPLRIRQELGLGEEAVHWSAALTPAAANNLAVEVFIVRREALDDVAAWRDRHRLDRLWVGSDLSAIGALERRAGGAIIVVNADGAEPACFYADGKGRVVKGRGHTSAEGPPDLPELGWKADAGRAVFGASSSAVSKLLEHPRLRDLGEAPMARWLEPLHNGSAAAATAPADPILLGGILAAAERHPPLPSLLESSRAPSPLLAALEQAGARRGQRSLAALAALAALVLAAGLFHARGVRADAEQRVAERVRQIEPAERVLASQLGVLERVRASRQPVLPVFEALLQAAPQGVGFETFGLAANGQLQIEGFAPDAGAPTRFSQELSRSPVFSDVRLQDVQQEQRQNRTKFKLTAQVRDRRRR